MTQRIFRSIFTAAIAVFLAALVLIIGVLYGYFANVQRQQLKMQLALTEQGLAGQGLPFLQEIPLFHHSAGAVFLCRSTAAGRHGAAFIRCAKLGFAADFRYASTDLFDFAGGRAFGLAVGKQQR